MSELQRRHIDFPRRKALAARLATAMAFVREGIPGCEENDDDNILALYHSLVSAANELRVDVPPYRRLDKAIDECMSTALQKRSADDNGYVKRISGEIRTFIKTINCDNCATNVCDGKDVETDDGNMSERGLCIGPIKSLFNSCQEHVKTLYSRVDKHGHVTRCPVWLETTHCSRHEDRWVLDEANVDGSTDCGETRADKGASVILTIKDHAFDTKSLLMLPYVFFHELVCHAYQGLDSNQRENSTHKCSWSEGWMDACAIEVTKQWIERSPSESLPTWVADNRKSVLDACNELHKIRHKQSGYLQPRFWHRRAAARTGFGLLQEGFRGNGRHKAFADRRIMDFSLLMNLSWVEPQTREANAQRLSGLLQVPRSIRFERTVGACAQFVIERQPPETLFVRLRQLEKDA